MAANAIVTIVRPDLTPEEREKRMKELEDAMRRLWIAAERARAKKASRSA